MRLTGVQINPPWTDEHLIPRRQLELPEPFASDLRTNGLRRLRVLAHQFNTDN